MKYFTKRSFITNLGIMFLCVVVPYVVSSFFLTYLWIDKTKDQAYESDTTMLSLAAQSCDNLLSDTTQIMALLEFDSNFTTALDSLNQADTKISATHLLYLNNVWNNTSRALLAKPYVKSAYLYLEKRPDIVFTNEGVRKIDNLRETSWIEAYQNQDPNINIWADSLGENTIFLFRRVPILQWENTNKGVMVVSFDRKYFDSMFSNFLMINEKDIYILDDQNTQIYSNTSSNAETYVSFDDIRVADTQRMVKSTSKEDFLVSIVNSRYFNWTYISAVPLSIVLSQLNGMIKTTVVFSCILLSVCLFLTLFVTINNYRPVKLMLHMINEYNEHNTIHHVKASLNNEYGYIIYNLLQTFIKKQEVEKKLSEEIALQKESSLLALQSQINPHFLYNLLETINWEAIDLLGEGNTISKILLSMASNLRYITTNSYTPVTIREDLDNLKTYIAIYQMMDPDRISFTFRVDPSLLSIKVHKLLIQPLVENAINHGMSDTKEGGRIRISIKKVKGFLLAKVTDNGRGISKERLEILRSQLKDSAFPNNEHLGLKNVDDRLKLKYGTQFGLKLRSKPGKGTVVYFVLPINE